MGEGDGEPADLAEGYWVGSDRDAFYVSTWGAKSFAELAAREAAARVAHRMGRYTDQYKDLVDSIMWDEDIPSEGKAAALATLTQEFAELMADLRTERAAAEAGTPLAEAADGTQPLALREEFASSVQLIEGTAPPDPRQGIHLLVEIIRPGLGNRKHRNLYPAATLAAAAPLFVGAKMYESDHRPEEKSTRTWVSTLVEHVGFSEAGGPIYKAYAHSPDFAQRVLNLHANGLVESLHCSILGQGRGREGMFEGEKCTVVEAITAVESVDWVTRAGAGGHALGLAEAEEGGEPMTEEIQASEAGQVTATTDFADAVGPQPVAEGEPPTVPVVIQEGEPEPETPVAEGEPEPETPVAEGEVAIALSEAEARAYLETVPMNPAIAEYLATGTYRNAEELAERAQGLLQMLRQVSQAGQPLGLGATPPPTLEERQQRLDEGLGKVMGKYFL